MARVMAWNVNEKLLSKVALYATLTGLTRAEIIDEALTIYFRTPGIKKHWKKMLKEHQLLLESD